MPLDIVHSVCPHDCPSTCALEVERLDARTHRPGARRGASNGYTAGVVCAKVARYAERLHHPDRLAPAAAAGRRRRAWAAPPSSRSAGTRRSTRSPSEFARAAQRHGPEAVWPYFYAGTMGLVQRDGIDRLRHVMRYSRQFSTICIALSDAGWHGRRRRQARRRRREIAETDLIVVWGGNPVATQVNVMTHIAARPEGARRQAGRGRSLSHAAPPRSPTCT